MCRLLDILNGYDYLRFNNDSSVYSANDASCVQPAGFYYTYRT